MVAMDAAAAEAAADVVDLVVLALGAALLVVVVEAAVEAVEEAVVVAAVMDAGDPMIGPATLKLPTMKPSTSPPGVTPPLSIKPRTLMALGSVLRFIKGCMMALWRCKPTLLRVTTHGRSTRRWSPWRG